MQRRDTNFVLPYQRADEHRREAKEHFWTGIAGVLAYSVVWGVVGAVAAALLGSVVLWGALLASAAK